MIILKLLLLLNLSSLAVVADFDYSGLYHASQQVLSDEVTDYLKTRTPEYNVYVKQFSTPYPGTSTVLFDSLRKLHPNAPSFVATQSHNFKFQEFAADIGNQVKIRQLETSSSIVMKNFVPAGSRRGGNGTVVDRLVFAGFELEWERVEYTLYAARWNEGMGTQSQYHIISPSSIASEALIVAISEYSDRLDNAILVFDQGYWNPDRKLWKAVQKASWKDVILDVDLKKALQHEYTSFYKSEKTYADLQVPWKRGLILLGPPGNGKTISTKAIMKDAGVPVLYVKSFHTYGGDELGIRMIFERARKEAPCLLVLEDLDSLINDNNRSFFLNEVDGLEDNDGLLLIGTTNHFDRLNPALSSRPSRFDRKYTFPNPSYIERLAYAHYWQLKLTNGPGTHLPFPNSLEKEVADKTEDFSFSHMKEAFVSSLLTLAGQKHKEEELEFRRVLLEQIAKLRKEIQNRNDDDHAC